MSFLMISRRYNPIFWSNLRNHITFFISLFLIDFDEFIFIMLLKDWIIKDNNLFYHLFSLKLRISNVQCYNQIVQTANSWMFAFRNFIDLRNERSLLFWIWTSKDRRCLIFDCINNSFMILMIYKFHLVNKLIFNFWLYYIYLK